MNINNFSLKYEISENTYLDLHIVRQNAISELREDKYRIVQETDKCIKFDNAGPPIFEIRGASMSKLESGILELSETGGNTVKLTYFISYKYMLLALVAILILTAFLSLFMLGMGAFLIIIFVIELIKQKSNAKELITRILKPEIR